MNQARGIWAVGRDGPAVLHIRDMKAMVCWVPLPSTSFGRAASSSLWFCQRLNIAAGASSAGYFSNMQGYGRWGKKIHLLFCP